MNSSCPAAIFARLAGFLIDKLDQINKAIKLELKPGRVIIDGVSRGFLPAPSIKLLLHFLLAPPARQSPRSPSLLIGRLLGKGSVVDQAKYSWQVFSMSADVSPESL